MLDKSIPYFNIIMKCPDINASKPVALPAGYSFKFFAPGDEEHWAAIESSVGEFDSHGEALAYFYDHYMPCRDDLEKRCLFVVDKHQLPVGTCTAWWDSKDNRIVNSLHWFAVYPGFQGLGIGKALVSEILSIYKNLSDDSAVYLHTQTWSTSAIGIYLKSGFRALKTEIFSDNRNDYTDAVAVLRGVLRDDIIKILINSAL